MNDAENEKPDYLSMTVNERLFAAGLLDESTTRRVLVTARG